MRWSVRGGFGSRSYRKKRRRASRRRWWCRRLSRRLQIPRQSELQIAVEFRCLGVQIAARMLSELQQIVVEFWSLGVQIGERMLSELQIVEFWLPRLQQRCAPPHGEEPMAIARSGTSSWQNSRSCRRSSLVPMFSMC